VFGASLAPASSRFQLVSGWRPIERRIYPRYETNVRVDIRNVHDGLTQEGTIVDMSEGGLRVETRRPVQGQGRSPDP
jgi:PilZ domain